MPCAVVLGFNIHGLAVARALAKAGIEVHALAASGDTPTVATRFARVHVEKRVNSEELVPVLKEFSRSVLGGRTAVLFPTSDNMVRALAGHWPELQDDYLLSWAHCRALVQVLLSKDNLPDLCRRNAVAHPSSVTVSGTSDCERVFTELHGPVIIKPARPLSSFKTLMVDGPDALQTVIREYSTDLPFVAQHYIDGGEDDLYFCTMYLRNGKRICAFTGRKLRASPPGMGQGTVMAGEGIPELLTLSDRFLLGLDLSGPVALEFKKDSAGKYWLIEPNVGRTEFCVDLTIQSGINLPLIEYADVTGRQWPDTNPRSPRERIWFDTDKDPRCYLKLCIETGKARPFGKQPVFPYFGHSDYRPLFSATRSLIGRAVRRVVAPLARVRS